MLTIKDLAESKPLNRQDMQRVKGGQAMPNIFETIFTDYGYSEKWSIQESLTAHTNQLAQSSDVVSGVSGKGNFVNVRGGFNIGHQANYSDNYNG